MAAHRYPENVGASVGRGRAAHERRAWAEAFELLTRADREETLGAEDLELLAMSAYLVGRDDDYLRALERAHHAHLEGGSAVQAARCAFWLGLRVMFRGERGRASGWLSRARRLLEGQDGERAEHGYLLLPLVEQELAAGDDQAAYASAQRAAEIGERFGEAELVALARHLQGKAHLQQGLVASGLALFDEAMVAVTTRELSPLVTGLVYCGVIEGCQLVYALDRAQEWTSALSAWCERQPEMVAFAGLCQVHRAEILQLRGAWPDAIEEARRAGERCRGVNEQAAAAALYQQAEIHRLRGELAPAEEAYRAASQSGWEPQPGLALLRMMQGRLDTAAASIRRVASAASDPWQRARLLPALVEIALGSGDVEGARNASGELERMAASFHTDVLEAMAAQAAGAVALAAGDARAALEASRRSWQLWQVAEAPYPAARARTVIGQACRALGDDEGGSLELGAARIAFERLGAAPDVARIDALLESPHAPQGLSARELQVLRLVAAGKTNKAIARELSLSEKTVERHLSNIFTKADVRTRAAATAYAYEHHLV